MAPPIKLIAPTDHTKLHIGYASYEVSSPSWGQGIYLHYVFEPPHGDCCLQLLANRQTLPGYIWGNKLYWSPCGRYISADWTGSNDALERRGVLVDLASSRYLDLGPHFQVTKLEAGILSGVDIGGIAREVRIDACDHWQPIASHDLQPIFLK